MEILNYDNADSNSISEEESVDLENQFLFDFLFDKTKADNTSNRADPSYALLNLSKDDNRGLGREGQKNGRSQNGRFRKNGNTNKKDLESPYRKVIVTTDLKSNYKSSKFHSMTAVPVTIFLFFHVLNHNF